MTFLKNYKYSQVAFSTVFIRQVNSSYYFSLINLIVFFRVILSTPGNNSSKE